MTFAVYEARIPDDEGSGFLRVQHELFKRPPQRPQQWIPNKPFKFIRGPARPTGRPLPLTIDHSQSATLQTSFVPLPNPTNFNALVYQKFLM